MPQKWSEMTPEQRARKRAKTLAWYYANRDRIAAEKKTEDGRAKQREYVRQYRARNREKVNEAAKLAMRRAREEDPERSRETQRRSHAKHRVQRAAAKKERWPEVREAWNAKRREHHAQHREDANAKRKENAAARRQLYPWEKLLRSASARAAARGVEFSLTREWCESRWTGLCEVSGLPFIIKDIDRPGPKLFSPSIDQIRPKGGYTPDNCRFVLWAVNALKHDGSDDDMLLVARAIVSKNPL